MTDDANDEALLARSLMRRSASGILSTMSVELPGYPFGSVTPFVMTYDGRPVVYVSNIAQHTANMVAEPKACLTVIESGEGNQQEFARVTLVGDAVKVPDDRLDEVSRSYFRLFPEARSYGQTHGFAFYWLQAVRVRYIGGFGKIFWIEPEAWSFAAPAWLSQLEHVCRHMNEDHAKSLIAMARHFGAVYSVAAELVGVDIEGCHVRADGKTCYIPFDAPCHTQEELRSALVRLARAAGSGATREQQRS